MKSKFLFVILILLCASYAKADQLVWITQDQAKAAVAFLKQQSEIIAWCACCESDSKSVIKVTNSYYQHARTAQDYYEVFIVGTDNEGKDINSAFDLAYLHYKKNSTAICVGKGLGFECDPCTSPFAWPNSNGIASKSYEPDNSGSYDAKATDDNGFVFVGKTSDGTIYSVRVEKKNYQSVDTWVKDISPVKYIKNSKGKTVKTGGNYSLSFMTIHCDEKKFDIEEVIKYSSGGNLIKDTKVSLYGNRIIPGSIMESISEQACSN
jgi:hypothetical protein